MTNNNYHVLVIPNLDTDRKFRRVVTAQDATAAAGAVLLGLGGKPVDCIEVTPGTERRRIFTTREVFYGCQYGVALGFLFDSHLVLAGKGS